MVLFSVSQGGRKCFGQRMGLGVLATFFCAKSNVLLSHFKKRGEEKPCGIRSIPPFLTQPFQGCDNFPGAPTCNVCLLGAVAAQELGVGWEALAHIRVPTWGTGGSARDLPLLSKWKYLPKGIWVHGNRWWGTGLLSLGSLGWSLSSSDLLSKHPLPFSFSLNYFHFRPLLFCLEGFFSSRWNVTCPLHKASGTGAVAVSRRGLQTYFFSIHCSWNMRRALGHISLVLLQAFSG